MLLAAYTSAELIIVIGAACSAVGGMVVAIITAWRTGNKVVEVAKITDAKVDQVHTLTNDRATKADKKIEDLQEQITELISVIAKKDQASAILADRITQSSPISNPIAVSSEVEKNVETIKNDVKEVKQGVEEVKAEVTKGQQ